MSKKLLILILFSFFSTSFADSPSAQEIYQDRPDWVKYFKDNTDSGTILIYNRNKNDYFVYNIDRARKRYSPVSTFKIPNSLISLELGSVKDVDNDIIKWDGVEREYAEWNKDMNLRTAFKVSAVPVYQELARRNTMDKMTQYVRDLKYGNMMMSNANVDNFWLEKDLTINCFEQLDFMRKLYRNDLPFSVSTMDAVKDIMLNEEGDRYVLRGKTGWGQQEDPQIGWFVGWLEVTDLERGDNVYFFAMNMDIQNAKKLSYRKSITKDILSDLAKMSLEPF